MKKNPGSEPRRTGNCRAVGGLVLTVSAGSHETAAGLDTKRGMVGWRSLNQPQPTLEYAWRRAGLTVEKFEVSRLIPNRELLHPGSRDQRRTECRLFAVTRDVHRQAERLRNEVGQQRILTQAVSRRDQDGL